MYNLVDSEGNVDQARVLKCKHPHALLTKIRREWEVGRRVSSLFSPETSLPGYMATGEAVVTEKGSYQGRQHFLRCSPHCCPSPGCLGST